MIQLKRETTNKLFLTLNESMSDTNNNLILRLTSNSDFSNIDISLDNDLSNNPTRYNEFDLIEGTGATETTLVDSTYDYRVYEATGATIDASSVVIESGLVMVDFAKNDSDVVSYQNNTNNVITFK